MTSLVPKPPQDVHLFWEDVSLGGGDFEVGQAELLEDSQVVASCLLLCLAADVEVVHQLDAFSCLQLLLDDFSE